MEKEKQSQDNNQRERAPKDKEKRGCFQGAQPSNLFYSTFAFSVSYIYTDLYNISKFASRSLQRSQNVLPFSSNSQIFNIQDDIINSGPIERARKRARKRERGREKGKERERERERERGARHGPKAIDNMSSDLCHLLTFHKM